VIIPFATVITILARLVELGQRAYFGELSARQDSSIEGQELMEGNRSSIEV